MNNVLRTGLAWLTSQLREHASETVSYARGYDSVDVPAVFGKKLLKLDDGFGGIRMEWTDLDFLIAAADLFFVYGDLITPARGDLVYVRQGDQVQVFEVFPFGNEPPWRFADPHQSMYRIHCKWINTEALCG